MLAFFALKGHFTDLENHSIIIYFTIVKITGKSRKPGFSLKQYACSIRNAVF